MPGGTSVSQPSCAARYYVAMPLGVLIAGPLLDGVGLRPTMLAIGACYLATTLTLVVNPALRDMERPAAG